VISKSLAQIRVGAGAHLEASGDVSLTADGVAEAQIITRNRYLGITYGSSSPTAKITLENGAALSAGGDVQILSTASNTLDVRTLVPASSEIAHFSISYGKARTNARADIQAGASVAARNATIRAENTNSFTNTAASEGFAASETTGVGAAFVLGSHHSQAQAVVSGNIKVEADLCVESRSQNLKNESRSFAQISDPAETTPFLERLTDFLEDVDLSPLLGSDPDLDPRAILPDLTLGAAVVLVESENKAAALLNEGAFVEVGGALSIMSDAKEPFQASATANAADSTSIGIGGAIVFARVANQATSFIGPNVVVDVTGTILLDSDAVITNPIPAFAPTILLADTDTGTGTDRIGEEYADADAVAAELDAALQPLATFLAPYLADPDRAGTSFVHAGSSVPPDQVAIAGGVNYLDVYNQAASGIAAGAQVNQRGYLAASEQDVVLDAAGTVYVANLAGLDSALNFTGSGPNSAGNVGGYFNGLWVDNYARAYIEDRADVHAARDVTLHSLTTNHVLSVVEAGAEGLEVGIDGAVGLVILGHESLAYIEDRARVHAGRDVLLDADNTGSITNVAGGVASGQNTGVGVSAAVTIVTEPKSLDEGGPEDEQFDGRSKTHAFIGDALAPVGASGTGGETGYVEAGQNVSLDAASSLETWAISVSGAASGGAFKTTVGLGERHGGLEFGLGLSGDAAVNELSTSVQAFVRDTVRVNAGDQIFLQATDAPHLVAGAGAVAFGNHLGIGGALARNALDGLTRAYTQDTTLDTTNVSLLATDVKSLLAFSDGGSGSKANVAVAGSVNWTDVRTLAEAALGARSLVPSVDHLAITANGDLLLVSSAGASSAANQGFLAVGAAVDIGSIVNGAYAFVGEEASLATPNDVHLAAATHERVLSVAASMADAGDGPQNRLYRNNGTAAPFAGVSGTDVGGRDTLTSTVALGDIDGDGDLDLVTGNFAQFNRRYLNDGSGQFEAGKELGSLMAALQDFESPTFAANSLIPDLTLALLLEDFDGDGDLDAVAGNLGQANRLYRNDGEGNFETGCEVGVGELQVTIDPSITDDNLTMQDLIDDLQGAIDTQLVSQGLLAGTVRVEWNGAQVVLASGTRELDSRTAEQRLAAAIRDSRLETDDGGELVLPLRFADADLTTSLAAADVDGDGDVDLVAGNLNGHLRLYLNDGSGNFGVARDVSEDVLFTTSVVLADLDGDRAPDLIAGNVGFDLAGMIDEGLVRVTDFLRATAVNLVALVESGLVSLLDLVQRELVDRFGFDPLAAMSIQDVIAGGMADLADLAREGLVQFEEFANIALRETDLLDSGLVTAEELAEHGLVDESGNVFLHALVDSGIVHLEELIGDDLVGIDDLEVSHIKLGNLLSTPLTSLEELVSGGIADVTDALAQQLDLRALIESGLADLADLVREELVGFGDLDQRRLDLHELTSAFSFGGPTRIYFNLGNGCFSSGEDLSSDRFITRALAVGDVDGDGDLDVIVGNAGTASRLYRNDGSGHFAAGVPITESGPLTQDIVLIDVDNDHDLDLVTGNLWSTNRLYLNDGHGNFAGGTEISSDAGATVAIALADTDGDCRVDLVAGDAKAAIGAAGSVSAVEVGGDVKAYIAPGASLRTDGNLFVRASDRVDLVTIAGADASSDYASVGLSLATPHIRRDVAAYIAGNVSVGLGAVIDAPCGVFVEAVADDDLLGYASGKATADDAALAASAVAHRMDSRVEAYVGQHALVTALNDAAAERLNVEVRAKHQTATLGVAGAFGGALQTGIGAAVQADILAKTVRSRLDPGADVRARNDVLVEAISHETLASAVGGLGGGFGLGVAGSVAFAKLDKHTEALVDGAKVVAGGNVVVWADSQSVFQPTAGAAGLGLGGGIGAAGAVFLKADETQARITGTANVTALAQREPVPAFTGTRDDTQVRETRDVRGVAVIATNTDDLDPIALGAAAGFGMGIAGSVTAYLIDNVVEASIEQGAVVNREDGDDADASADQLVHVFAWDETEVLDLAGAASAAMILGVAGALDFGQLKKKTRAFLGSDVDVDANGDVELQAFSEERLSAITATAGAGGFGGAVALLGRHTIEPHTAAHVDQNALVHPAGQRVRFGADDQNELEYPRLRGDAGGGDQRAKSCWPQPNARGAAPRPTSTGEVAGAALDVSAEAHCSAHSQTLLAGIGTISGAGALAVGRPRHTRWKPTSAPGAKAEPLSGAVKVAATSSNACDFRRGARDRGRGSDAVLAAARPSRPAVRRARTWARDVTLNADSLGGFGAEYQRSRRRGGIRGDQCLGRGRWRCPQREPRTPWRPISARGADTAHHHRRAELGHRSRQGPITVHATSAEHGHGRCARVTKGGRLTGWGAAAVGSWRAGRPRLTSGATFRSTPPVCWIWPPSAENTADRRDIFSGGSPP
jgi:hypothetical protein